MKVDDATLVLGIETSCDETAAALVMGGYDVVSSAVSTQIDLHAQYGGVVPEIAGRAHLDLINPMVARAIVEPRDLLIVDEPSKGLAPAIIDNMIEDIKRLSPAYLEAKPLRSVGLDEFAGAVLPRGSIGGRRSRHRHRAGHRNRAPEAGLFPDLRH